LIEYLQDFEENRVTVLHGSTGAAIVARLPQSKAIRSRWTPAELELKEHPGFALESVAIVSS
jgi:hypothetical protein